MPQINYDPGAASSNAQVKVAKATGLNNFSESSKTKAISDIVTSDVSTFIGVVSDVMDNMYPETSIGRYLDVNGAQNKVYRNTITHLDLKDTDLVVRITPRDAGSTFFDILRDSATIFPNEFIEVSSKFKIIFTAPVLIHPSSTELYASVRIESVDKSNGFTINTGDVFKFPSTFRSLASLGDDLQLVFEKEISLEVQDESDETFRQRVIAGRDSTNIAIPAAIGRAVSTAPNISGIAIYDKARGSSTMDIYLTTKKMQEGLEDDSASIVRDLIDFKLRSVASGGISYYVELPIKLELGIKYTYTSNLEIAPEAVAGGILTAFSSLYRLSNVNSVMGADLQRAVEQSMPSLTQLTITNMALFDTSLEEYISYSGVVAQAPKGTYITLSREDIEKVG
jgi:uncharacterized phage protein gp47/JayE